MGGVGRVHIHAVPVVEAEARCRFDAPQRLRGIQATQPGGKSAQSDPGSAREQQRRSGQTGRRSPVGDDPLSLQQMQRRRASAVPGAEAEALDIGQKAAVVCADTEVVGMQARCRRAAIVDAHDGAFAQRRVQRQAAHRERHEGAAGRQHRRRRQRDGALEHAVEQRRIDAADVVARGDGQFGDGVITRALERAHRLEVGAIAQPHALEARIEGIAIKGAGRTRDGGRRHHLGRQRMHGAAQMRRTVVGRPAAHRAAAGRIDIHRHVSRRSEHQRAPPHQVAELDRPVAGQARRQQLQIAGSGKDGLAVDHVIARAPVVRGDVQYAGLRRFGRRAVEAHRCRRLRTTYPVAGATEGIGGQIDRLRQGRTRFRPQHGPPYRCAGEPACRQRERIGALAGGRLPAVGRPALHAASRQRLQQIGQRAGDDQRPRAQRRTPELQRRRDARAAGRRIEFITVRGEPVAEARDDRLQLFVVAGRERKDRGDSAASDVRRYIDPLLDDHVRVGAAGAEGTEGGTARLTIVGPGLGALRNAEGRAVQIDGRIDARRMQRCEQAARAELQQQPGQSGDASGRFEVTDTRLDRTERAALRPVGRPARQQALDLDRIAQPGAGAVRFDIADAGRCKAGTRQRVADEHALAARTGHRVAGGATAVRNAGGADHAEDAVTGRACVGQPAQHDDAHALARHEAVRRVAEGVTATGRRQHALLAQLHILGRMQVKIDAASQRHRAFVAAQAFAGEMQGGQRR